MGDIFIGWKIRIRLNVKIKPTLSDGTKIRIKLDVKIKPCVFGEKKIRIRLGVFTKIKLTMFGAFRFWFLHKDYFSFTLSLLYLIWFMDYYRLSFEKENSIISYIW